MEYFLMLLKKFSHLLFFSRFISKECILSALSLLDYWFLADWLFLIRLCSNAFFTPDPTNSETEYQKSHSDKQRIKNITQNNAV